jgi:hypothetical protein
MIQTLLVWSFGELMRNILGTDDNGNKMQMQLNDLIFKVVFLNSPGQLFYAS